MKEEEYDKMEPDMIAKRPHKQAAPDARAEAFTHTAGLGVLGDFQADLLSQTLPGSVRPFHPSGVERHSTHSEMYACVYIYVNTGQLQESTHPNTSQ